MSENISVKCLRVPLWSFIFWLKDGFGVLVKNWLKAFAVSLVCMLLVVIFLVIGKLFASNSLAVMIISASLSVIFPILIACLSNLYLLFYQQQLSLKKIFKGLMQGYILRLIIVYLLLALAISIGAELIAAKLPNSVQIVNISMQSLLMLLQIVILIALPMNILASGKYLPFRALLIGLKAGIINLIPCLLFVLCFFGLLLLAIFVGLQARNLIGEYAIVVYFIELIILTSWLGLSSAAMAKNLFAYHSPISSAIIS